MSTFCHGIASAQSLDKSGEIVQISGLDITSLAKTGVLNYEHKSDVPGQICGKILTAKKIFTASDCSNEHETYFWNKAKTPFVYITAELLDDYCQSGKDAAGLFRYDHDKKGQNSHAILGFSVEGSEIPNSRPNKMTVARGIARKVTLTASPCNSQCVAELLVSAPKSQVKDDFADLFKTDLEAITLFKSGEGEALYETYLAKKEQDAQPLFKGHKEAAEHHREAALSATDAKSADEHLEQMKFHNNAALTEGKKMKKSENLCKLHKAKVDEGKDAVSRKTARSNRKSGIPENYSLPMRAGDHLKNGSPIQAKLAHEQSVARLKSTPKPDLGKSEPLNKAITPPGKIPGTHRWTGTSTVGPSGKTEVRLSHPKHGLVTGFHNKETNKYELHHNGTLANFGGKKGVTDNAKDLMSHAKGYMQALDSGKTFAPKMHNIPSAQMATMAKAIDAGSYNAAPSTLVNGAAYQTESVGAKTATTGAEENTFQGTKKKDLKVKKKDWNEQAKSGYETWPQRAKFEAFMKARLPHLHDGEIRAIGQVLSLKKSIDMEKALSELIDKKKK